MSVLDEDKDVVMLTYSRGNCQKTNFAIQDRVDAKHGRELPENRTTEKFYKGDRCCFDKPIELYTIKFNKNYAELDVSLGITLYNGEIFDILDTENVKIKTPLNKFNNIAKLFNGQILTIKRINDNIYSSSYRVIHIPEDVINETRKIIRRQTRRDFYIALMSNYVKIYPKLDYGYCITVYKSQGSEWRNVFIHMSSIKWCIAGSNNNIEFKKKKALFKATYTALTRASHNIWLFWF